MSRGRPPTPPGQHGKITTTRSGGSWHGETWLTLQNGQRQRVRVSGATSENKAKTRVLERCQEYLDGQHQEHDGISPQSTVRQAVEDWLSRHTGADATVTRYRKAAVRSIYPALGKVRLVHLSTGTVEDFLDDPTTVSPGLCQAILSGTCADLLRREILQRNPVAAVRKRDDTPSFDDEGEPIGVHALTPDDVTDLLALVETAAKGSRSTVKKMLPDLLLYILGSGTRIGEALGTRWSDLDLESIPGVVHVRGQVQNVPGQGAQWTPRLKTKDARRSLVLSPSLITMLKKRRVEQTEAEVDTEYVFPDRDGGPRAPESIRTQLRQILKKDDDERWQHTSPKTLRATHATAVVESVTVLGASRQLGHSRIDTVQRHYLAKPSTGPDVSTAVEHLLGHDSNAARDQ